MSRSLGGDVVDDAVADAERALGDLLEPGDHPQAGRLAAARWSDQDHELAVADLEVEVLDGGDVAVLLVDVIERHGRHARASSVPGHRGLMHPAAEAERGRAPYEVLARGARHRRPAGAPTQPSKPRLRPPLPWTSMDDEQTLTLDEAAQLLDRPASALQRRRRQRPASRTGGRRDLARDPRRGRTLPARGGRSGADHHGCHRRRRAGLRRLTQAGGSGQEPPLMAVMTSRREPATSGDSRSAADRSTKTLMC